MIVNYSKPVGTGVLDCPQNILTNFGEIANKHLINMSNFYQNIKIEKYVVMPNHFHAIITISRADMESAPTVSEIVQAFKRYSTVEYVKMVKDGKLPPFDKQIWQRSFYDHVIRNRDDYNEIYKYIYENPMKWQFDQLYAEE